MSKNYEMNETLSRKSILSTIARFNRLKDQEKIIISSPDADQIPESSIETRSIEQIVTIDDNLLTKGRTSSGRKKAQKGFVEPTTLLVRPKNREKYVYDGVIESLKIGRKFYSDERLNVNVKAFSETGEIPLKYSVPVDWYSSSSEFIKLLTQLELLPEPGCSVDLEKLAGTKVQVITESFRNLYESPSIVVVELRKYQ